MYQKKHNYVEIPIDDLGKKPSERSSFVKKDVADDIDLSDKDVFRFHYMRRQDIRDSKTNSGKRKDYKFVRIPVPKSFSSDGFACMTMAPKWITKDEKNDTYTMTMFKYSKDKMSSEKILREINCSVKDGDGNKIRKKVTAEELFRAYFSILPATLQEEIRNRSNI